MIQFIRETLTQVNWLTVGMTVATFLLGYLIAKAISMIVGRQLNDRMDQTTGMVARKLSFYGILVLTLAIVFKQMNVSLGTLLTAGGLFGVAIGFASQAAMSNIISGVFLIFERPFEVGDVIKVDNNLGAVQSIDLLSTKLRTFDNLAWRMPNEKLFNSDIFTITEYEIRRMDIAASISYQDDIPAAREELLECAEANPMVMAQPEPITLVKSIGESGIDLTLRFWFHREDYLTVISDLTQEMKVALEDAGMTIPYPHRTIYVRDEGDEWRKAQQLQDEMESS